jgi:hypothetical protein
VSNLTPEGVPAAAWRAELDALLEASPDRVSG